MGQKQAHTSEYQDVGETIKYTEMQNLNESPAQLDVSIQSQRPPWTRNIIFTRYLHPVAWLLLLCIGGPILLYNLWTHHLDGFVDNNGIIASQPCDVGRVWSSWATLFQVNIRTGHLSFATAKIIDVVFDLVVGRGGQLVLAWICYRSYTDVLMWMAEKGRLRYDVFASMAVYPLSIGTLGSALSALLSTHPLRAKVTFVWFAATLSYVFAYPTLVSASTSLVGATSSAIQLPNNATAPLLDYINSASYSLADTGLKDKPNPWIIPTSDIHTVPAGACNIMVLGGTDWSLSNANDDKTHITVNETIYNISEDTIIRCGFNYGGTFYGVDTGSALYTYKPRTFYERQLICVPDRHSYQWGASWEMLVVVLVLQIVWGLAVLLMWVEANTGSVLVKQGRKMGLYTAVLDLSGPLRARLEGQEETQNAGHAYNEADLKKLAEVMDPVGYEVGHGVLGNDKSVRLVSGIDDDTGQLLERSKR